MQNVQQSIMRLRISHPKSTVSVRKLLFTVIQKKRQQEKEWRDEHNETKNHFAVKLAWWFFWFFQRINDKDGSSDASLQRTCRHHVQQIPLLQSS
mmetsp:Transcript_63859/g.71483  ORF Transcript_63859/g.71483 Transcript_63859/m.71483 type:complete len:95 (+) Transcript_63859:109-393(+)